MARNERTTVLGVSTSKGRQFHRFNERITPGARGLSAIFGVAGVLHFLRPAVFDRLFRGGSQSLRGVLLMSVAQWNLVLPVRCVNLIPARLPAMPRRRFWLWCFPQTWK